MRAVLRLAAHELHARRKGWAVLVLLVGMTGGAVLTAAAAATLSSLSPIISPYLSHCPSQSGHESCTPFLAGVAPRPQIALATIAAPRRYHSRGTSTLMACGERARALPGRECRHHEDQAPASTMAANCPASRLAPPTRNPSTLVAPSDAAAVAFDSLRHEGR